MGQVSGVQVKVQESASQVIYSDVVLINGSPMGFVLNFGQWAPEEPGLVRVYSRVGMSPNHLKLLARLLAENVAGYESQFGEIVVGDQREAPHKHIGFEPVEPKPHEISDFAGTPHGTPPPAAGGR